MKHNNLQSHISDLKDTIATLSMLNADINNAISLISECYKTSNKLLLIGNGGSASEAQHIATELVSTLTKKFKRQSLPAMALASEMTYLTALSNDFGFQNIFSRQIESFGNKGDVLIALSTSGNSQNIIIGVNEAKNKNLKVIGITGKEGGQLHQLCDISIRIPSTNTQRIQEISLFLQHYIVEQVEHEIFNN